MWEKFRKVKWETLIIFVIGLLLNLFLVWFIETKTNEPVKTSPQSAVGAPGVQPHVFVLPSFVRPIYPYSVIPGGVYSVEELQNAVATDAVVREHYRGFDTRHAYFTQLSEDVVRYVSYRKGDQIYVSRRPLTIPKGEWVVTDGSHVARARCGNRLFTVPLVDHVEPDLTLLHLDQNAPTLVADLVGPEITDYPAADEMQPFPTVPVAPAIAPAGDEQSPFLWAPGIFPLYPGFLSPPVVTTVVQEPSPPTTVINVPGTAASPEPRAFLLIALSILCFGLPRIKRRR